VPELQAVEATCQPDSAVVSIRELAEFCYRSGDIDHRFTPSPTGVQGTEGHQRVFNKRPASYASEYPVEYRHVCGGVHLLLRGRADGYDASRTLVEEIKTCRVNPRTIPESVKQLHLAQARLYAAIICAQQGLERLEVRLTWFNIDSEEEWVSRYHYSAAELDEFLQNSLHRFTTWLALLDGLRSRRNESIARLRFPYAEFRAGQRDIAELVYKCIAQRGQLLLEAPTGIGKTAAVLFPALKAMAGDKHDKLVYLTAKSVGRRAAEQTLAHFRSAGFAGSAMSLTARDKICLSPGKACHGDDCPYARGYYDKLPAAREAAIRSPSLTRDDIEKLAKTFELCPYQLAQDLLPWVDIVIADLHYFYSLTPLFSQLMESGQQRWTVLVDEAHNLPSRARKMYSASLSRAALMRAKKQLAKQAQASIVHSLAKVNRAMLALQKQPWREDDFHSAVELPEGLQDVLQQLVASLGEAMADDALLLQRFPALKDFYFQVLQFLRVAENWGGDYRFEMSRAAPGNSGASKTIGQSLQLDLNCLDPARLLAHRQQLLCSLTLFSATLSPIDWTRASLGLRHDAVCRRLSSPFSTGQMQVSVATHIDTRFRQRADSLPALAALLNHWLALESGNCIVYFPSYRYLQDCVEQLKALGLGSWGRSLWQQSPDQGEQQRHELLDWLECRRDVLAFCILGGVYGEGIDLPGERLCAVVIVGVGLPQVNRDTEQLRNYFELCYGQGFRYAYLYPGMQKVDQALGRVVRRADDSGRALLVDTRYSRVEYRQLLPPWWSYAELEGF